MTIFPLHTHTFQPDTAHTALSGFPYATHTGSESFLYVTSVRPENEWQKHTLISTLQGERVVPLHTYVSHPSTCSSVLQGLEGVSVPYTMHRDDGVAVVLLSFFLFTIWVLAHGGNYFARQWKDFFFGARERGSLFVQDTLGERYFGLFLQLQTAVLFGLLFFIYSTESSTFPLGNYAMPRMLMWTDVCLCVFFFILKRCLYGWVGWTLAHPAQRSVWYDAYSLLMGAQGVLLLPLTFVAVRLDLDHGGLIFSILAVFILTKILLLYKTFAIFFTGFHGFLMLILYLCALEIVPLLALWSVATSITTTLT